MGFKTFTLFAYDVPGYFGTAPKHDPRKAQELIIQLGLSNYELVSATSSLNAYPGEGDIYIGAYEHGVVIAHLELLASLLDQPQRDRNFGTKAYDPEFAQRFLALYPKGEVLALVLHSVVNLWGFSVHRNGKLVRCVSAADSEFHGAVGDPLPEELPLLKEHPIQTLDEEGLGEDLVFDVAARALGHRYDEVDLREILICSHYRKMSGLKALLKRFF